jgi:flagellar export protein FliJ
MLMLEKKAKRLGPVIEVRKAKFDEENNRLNAIRERKIKAVAAMREKQREYLNGVQRLNDERGTSNRLMLEALESGLDNVKAKWMSLYQSVVELEREERSQFEIMSRAHRDLEAICALEQKYRIQAQKEYERRDQKSLDEHSLRKFVRAQS